MAISFGLGSNGDSSNSHSNYKNNNPEVINSKPSETITISGSNDIRTINNPDKQMILIISGLRIK